MWYNFTRPHTHTHTHTHTLFPTPSLPHPSSSPVSCGPGAREEETDRGGEKKNKGLETATRQMPTESNNTISLPPPPPSGITPAAMNRRINRRTVRGGCHPSVRLEVIKGEFS
jgi:hypothetical protein